MSNLSRGRIVAYLAAIFLAGGISGAAVALSLGYNHKASPPAPQPMRNFCDSLNRKYQTRLSLTPTQAEKVSAILNRASKEMDGVHKKSTEQIRQIMAQAKAEIATHLTPEQKLKFEELERERQERAAKSRNKDKDKDRRSGDKPAATNGESSKLKVQSANE